MKNAIKNLTKFGRPAGPPKQRIHAIYVYVPVYKKLEKLTQKDQSVQSYISEVLTNHVNQVEAVTNK